MIEVSTGILIHAPVKKVFETAADPNKQLIWNTGDFSHLSSLSDGPLGKGSKFSCRVKGAGKMIYEFTEYLPYSRFTHASTTRMSYGVHYFSFNEKNNSTEFLQTMQIRLRGFAILLYPFAKNILKKQLNKINMGLKQYLEQNSY